MLPADIIDLIFTRDNLHLYNLTTNKIREPLNELCIDWIVDQWVVSSSSRYVCCVQLAAKNFFVPVSPASTLTYADITRR